MKVLDTDWPRNESRKPASRGWIICASQGCALGYERPPGQRRTGQIGRPPDERPTDTALTAAPPDAEGVRDAGTWFRDCWRPDHGGK